MKIVLATTNKGKLHEFKQLSTEAPWIELVLAPSQFNPQETGSTFFENARIKAQEAAKLTQLLSIADDSGLVVEALDGRPGIHSARYAEGSDANRRTKLLAEMSQVPENKRNAAFICSMVLCNPQGDVLHCVIRYWNGRIGFSERGHSGFGYDPLFYLLDQDLTAAELSSTQKNQISHRGLAWRQMQAYLQNNMSTLSST